MKSTQLQPGANGLQTIELSKVLLVMHLSGIHLSQTMKIDICLATWRYIESYCPDLPVTTTPPSCFEFIHLINKVSSVISSVYFLIYVIYLITNLWKITRTVKRTIMNKTGYLFWLSVHYSIYNKISIQITAF